MNDAIGHPSKLCKNTASKPKATVSILLSTVSSGSYLSLADVDPNLGVAKAWRASTRLQVPTSVRNCSVCGVCDELATGKLVERVHSHWAGSTHLDPSPTVRTVLASSALQHQGQIGCKRVTLDPLAELALEHGFAFSCRRFSRRKKAVQHQRKGSSMK